MNDNLRSAALNVAASKRNRAELDGDEAARWEWVRVVEAILGGNSVIARAIVSTYGPTEQSQRGTPDNEGVA